MAKKPTKPHASAPKTTKPRKSTKSESAVTPPAADQASKYTVGDEVSHPMFGNGAVTAIDGKKLTIEFSGNVTKQIIDSYVTPRKA